MPNNIKPTLAEENPQLAAEWHPTKNGSLTPNAVTSGSGKKVWWMCEHGHEWQAVVFNRVKGSGCPVCAGKVVVVGYNDLASVSPEVAAQWHPTKNGDLTPEDVTIGSNKKVWWLCPEGHEWQVRVADRTKGRGCPFCSGREVLEGFNDLATTNPQLAAEWHPTKNKELTPKQVASGSNKVVWWKCSEGHEWTSRIANRTRGSGCPVCAGRHPKEETFAVAYPQLATRWHPTKNGDLTPDMLTPGASKRVWWICERGHEWQGRVVDCTHGRGCPVCAGKRILIGYNDLAFVHPQLAALWHPTKNGDLTPEKISAGSNKKVWWMCEMGHEWQASVSNRTKGSGCPVCAAKRSKDKKR